MGIRIQDDFVKISLLLMVLVGTIRYYIDYLIYSNLSVVLMIFSILLVLLVILKNKKIKFNRSLFIISILMVLPSLYNNAYLQDGIYAPFAYYILPIIYGFLLSCTEISDKNIEFTLKLYGIFAVLTSTITWLSMFFPNWYVNRVVTLLPENIRPEIILNFTKLNCRPGLTSHYSRNAFFIILGTITFIKKYLESKNIKDLIMIIFLSITMLLVGKRGHLLFFVMALFFTYIIVKKLSVKTIIKLSLCGIIIIFCAFLAIKYIPGANYTYSRIMNKDNEDISSGRFEMYRDANRMYNDNNRFAIGWGQYAKRTNYSHPGLHNDYLQLFYETGFLGFIMIIGCNIFIFKRSLKFLKKNYALSSIIILYNCFFLLYSLTGIPHYDADSIIYYFIITAFLFNYFEKNQIKKETMKSII